MHFRSFLKVKVQIGDIFLGLYFIFFGVGALYS